MGTVLHVLDHSLPEQSGYASRSHAILSALAARGVDVEAVTSPKQETPGNAYDDVGGIRYWRSPVPAGTRTAGVLGQLMSIRYTRKRISSHLQESPVALIHAHSPCLNALAVERLGIPLVYEMRSSWEDAAVSSGTTVENSLRYRLSRSLETMVAKNADAVTVICDGLKRELVARGLPPDKVTIVPNALPESMFERADPGAVAAIRDRYALGNSSVIGYFGSYFEWEGIDSLLAALPAVISALGAVRLLLAGGGRQERFLRDRVAELELDEHVVFAGRLPPEQVLACYGVADLMVFPRLSDRLTEMVTPLKPLEAMAQGVPVLASDVGGHKELITGDVTGFLYKAGDGDALAASIVRILRDEAQARSIAAAGRRWVDAERRWSVVSERYLPVYDRLLGQSRRIAKDGSA